MVFIRKNDEEEKKTPTDVGGARRGDAFVIKHSREICPSFK